MEHLTQRMDTIRVLFSQNQGIFLDFQKSSKAGLPLTPLIVRVSFVIVLQLVLTFLASDEKMVSFLSYKS